jgi:hypothetical protein
VARQSIAAIKPRKTVVRVARVLSYLVYFYIIAAEIILFIGIFLLLFGANSTAGFTQWAYRNLDRVMEPFRGIFAPISLGTTSGNVEAVFDTAVLFAMIVYGILGLVMHAVITWLTGRLEYLEVTEAEAEREQEAARLAAQAAPPQQTPPPYQQA